MFHTPSMMELVVLAALGLLFFGKRLPEVGRSLGKGIVEFKKGLKGIEEDVEASSRQPSTEVRTLPEQKFDPYTGKALTPPDHKFDPYTGKPIEHSDSNDTAHAGAESH